MKLINSSLLTVVLISLPLCVSATLPSNTGTPSLNERAINQHQIIDKKILGIVSAVDQGEIATAQLAIQKSTNPLVTKYAKYLLKQHTENLKRIKALEHKTGLVPMQSKMSISMGAENKSSIKALSALNETEFDATYINDMVKGHTGGLKLIDTDLSKQVTNLKLKALLTQFRALVSRHLEKGLKLQSQLNHK